MIVDAIESWPGLITLAVIFAAGFFYTVPADKKAFAARDFSHNTHSLAWAILWLIGFAVWTMLFHRPPRIPF